MAVEQIFDPQVMGALIEREGYSVDCSDLGWDSSPETLRLRFLSTLARDARQGYREALVADCAMIQRIDAVLDLAPNFCDATGIALRAAKLSRATDSPLRIPNLLLCGPPGIGKSFWSHAVAAALGSGSKCFEHAMNCRGDSLGEIVGHSLSFRGARPGLVARALIESAQTPVLLIDEIDKAGGDREFGDPTDVFLTLLEPETARSFRDGYIDAPLRADKIIWLATANTPLKGPLADRFVTIHVAPPTDADRRSIATALYAKATAAFGGAIDPTIDADVADELAAATPRRQRIILDIALGYAAANGRNHLEVLDIRRAKTLLSSGAKPRIGFFAQPSD